MARLGNSIRRAKEAPKTLKTPTVLLLLFSKFQQPIFEILVFDREWRSHLVPSDAALLQQQTGFPSTIDTAVHSGPQATIPMSGSA
jgi:hypothetical protein